MPGHVIWSDCDSLSLWLVFFGYRGVTINIIFVLLPIQPYLDDDWSDPRIMWMASCIDDDDMSSKGFGGLTSSSNFSGDMRQKRWWFYNEIESGRAVAIFSSVG